MYDFASGAPLDVDRLRQRLQKLTDDQLIQFGRAARYMLSPEARWGSTPGESYVVQLREALEEWERRQQRRD